MEMYRNYILKRQQKFGMIFKPQKYLIFEHWKKKTVTELQICLAFSYNI